MEKNKLFSSINKVKPFLKWAGGKSQLLGEFKNLYPKELTSGKIKKYVEPFIGGGAVFFNLIGKYNFEEVILNDLNEELILSYKVIQNDVEKLIELLEKIEKKFFELKNPEQSDFYYFYRGTFNEEKKTINYNIYATEWISHASKLIFLNKTCFNGLYRLNKKGEFNVPFGRYAKPLICNKQNLKEVSKALIGVKLFIKDFEELTEFIDKDTFVYMDPPYRPLSKTSYFTSYSKYEFDDNSQVRLSKWFRTLDKSGASLLLSNSDPKNVDINDNFFDELYQGYEINRLLAARVINANPSGRGLIKELAITNKK